MLRAVCAQLATSLVLSKVALAPKMEVVTHQTKMDTSFLDNSRSQTSRPVNLHAQDKLSLVLMNFISSWSIEVTCSNRKKIMATYRKTYFTLHCSELKEV